MKNYCVLLMVISLVALAGCLPNLRVSYVNCSSCFSTDTIKVKITNTGLKAAGPQLTYIEINKVGAPNSEKPQTQYQVRVPQINPWGTWTSEAIPFSAFSNRGGINMAALTMGNVVVHADAKDMVAESNENDNVYDKNCPVNP